MGMQAETLILMRDGERLYGEKTPHDCGFSKRDVNVVDVLEDFVS